MATPHDHRELARTMVWFGLVVAASTELLSAFQLLHPIPVALAWLAFLVWGFPRRWKAPRWQPWEWVAFTAIAVVLGVIGLTGLRSAPNSADAMAYHLPRVVYWKQMGSVRFFPTSYLNQIMLAPLAEYFMLHTWLLSGSDRFINLVQWFGCAGSVAAVWMAAGELGGSRAGQWLAAVLVVTLPNGVLQASGAKNDYVLTLWLVCAVLFAVRGDWKFTGMAAGLAILTKATAYVFLPAALLPLMVRTPMRALVGMAAIALSINAPQYWRNFELSGSVLGFDSAHGDGKYRWRNERPGWRATYSNLLRHVSEQLGARSETWNNQVYQAVARAHQSAGIDLNDPATTWPGVAFAPPKNANHEASAHNRWHLLLAVFGMALAMARREWKLALYLGGLAVGFVLFAAYLKWQPFMQRLLLPLFVLSAPPAGVMLGRGRSVIAGVAVSILLLNATRPYLLENWTRRLRGPESVLTTARLEQYFNDTVQFGVKEKYLAVIEEARRDSCRTFAIDMQRFELEYPFQIALLSADPGAQFIHTGVHNASTRYRAPALTQPCATVCLACGADGSFLYQRSGN